MSYSQFQVRLSDGQKSALKSAHRNGRSATLQFAAGDIGVGDKLMLTERQINHLSKAKRDGKGARITLSATQMKQNGGFLQYLLPLVAPLVGSLLGGDGIKKKGSGMFLPGTTFDRRRLVGRGMMLPASGSGMMLPASGRGMMMP